ncbi:histidine kinase [Lysinibacillus sphaericus]|uniref:HAMP domain-containing sensor histidine kinase n=1 Tax=Lysinibacillus sphaericus TaxID=1421 RepID=UPI0018CE2A29|nr:HAMP domain-containing sensor histidine kinase [Lysinibacillus sphaericus]MBG9452941.1 histidine kinase [Lysinibacillus sphaericus]MBG9480124.1 histidine kinase [Lysinibacillus sphaericus]MBG9593748.1 histidine kinase [Lysinibacillus sphaericus]
MKNTELKGYKIILVVIFSLFIIYQLISHQIFYNHLKTDSITAWGEITAKLIEQNPENEAEIMKVLTSNSSDSSEYQEKGREIFRQYGLYEDLETKLFPLLNNHISSFNQTILWGMICFGLILFLANYIQYKIIFNKIKQLTSTAKKIIDGDYSVTINENKEGEIAKLAVSFRSMKDIIRKNMKDLLGEKEFLGQMLQDISHQLKTPLSTISIYNEMLLNEDLPRQQQVQLLQNNEIQISRMNVLIQNLLKVAKIDAKAVSFDKESLNLVETIHEVLNRLKNIINERNLSIDWDGTEEVVVTHDKLWMQEALMNLLKNAIEHSKPGDTITIQVNDTPIYTELIIQDFGEGIAAEDLPHIFNRFYKASTSKKHDSTGIGLALTKAIIEAHQALIKVESEKNVYTKFTITFIKF